LFELSTGVAKGSRNIGKSTSEVCCYETRYLLPLLKIQASHSDSAWLTLYRHLGEYPKENRGEKEAGHIQKTLTSKEGISIKTTFMIV
jgi:hypothetical protein